MSTAATPAPDPLVTLVPLAHVRPSPFNPRSTSGAMAVDELAGSLATHGLLEPIVVRPVDDPTTPYELIAGHRRVAAASSLGWASIPASIRPATDAEARTLALIENAQRVDLTPLEEAEVYAALAALGLTVREIATQVSRSPSHIAGRLKLTTLAPAVKKLLASGVLPVTHAVLLGRIPNHALQVEALAELVTEFFPDPEKPAQLAAVPLGVAKRVVESGFMTVLSEAPFDPEDATLSPLGACSTCPHRSGNDRDLFGDIKGKAICTHLADYRLKIETHLTRLREAGTTVLLTPEEVRPVLSRGGDLLTDAYVALSSVCPDDPKGRTYDDLLRAEPKAATVYAYHDGQVHRLLPTATLPDALKASGHPKLSKLLEPPPARDVQAASAAARDDVQKARAERQLQKAVDQALDAEITTTLTTAKWAVSDWTTVVVRLVLERSWWTLDRLLARYELAPADAGSRDPVGTLATAVAALPEAKRRAFVVDVLLFGLRHSSDADTTRGVVRTVLADLGVDLKATERRLRAEVKATQTAKAA